MVNHTDSDGEEPVPAIGCSYWSAGERSGEYTLGRVSASVDDQPLRLALPARLESSSPYVDAAFVHLLTGVEQAEALGKLYVGTPVQGIFDIEGHWAYDQVRQLLEAGIVGGYGDGTYRPNENLSRAAFAKMLVMAPAIPLRLGDAGGFADTAGHWVSGQGYVGAGILVPEEYPNRRFEPDRAITREEIAVMVTRALGLDAQAATRTVTVVDGAAIIDGRRFVDVDQWTRPGYIAVAVERGVITGYAVGDGFAYRPTRLATRAEAAVMVVRSLGR